MGLVTDMMSVVIWAVLCGGLLAAGVAVVAWLIMRAPGQSAGRALGMGRRDDLPSELLRRRYAAGEIDEDEYLRRLSGLSQL